VLQIEKKTQFIAVAAGENHTLMLTNNFQVLSRGSNTYGQLGGPSKGD
jgi:alpha-tubulin suppressor-like RCC1 family protein